MKKNLFALMLLLVILAVSCDNSVLRPTSVTVKNKSGVPVFWQLRKAGDPVSDVYLKMETGSETSFVIESRTDFILSYAGLATDNTAVSSNTLVINQTSDDIRQVEFNTVLPHEKIIFEGDSSDLSCQIRFKTDFSF